MISHARRFVAVVFVLLLGGLRAAHAEQPDFDLLRKHLYVIRGGGLSVQGLWKFDVEKRTYSRFHTLHYGETFTGEHNGVGGHIAPLEDRLVVQGTTFLEFDLASGRLLRRYKALPRDQHRWAFHGAPVTETMSKQLGIEAGYYGFPICPPGAGIVHTCGVSIQPPGYPRPSSTLYHVLLRRSLDPSDTALSLVKILPVLGPDLPPVGLSDRYPRFVAIDPDRKRFVMRHEVVFPQAGPGPDFSYLQRLLELPIRPGEIGDEVVLQEILAQSSRDPDDLFRNSRAFSYSPNHESFFHSFSYFRAPSNTPGRLIQQSNDLTREEQLSDGPEGLPTAIGALTSDLPERYIQVVSSLRQPISESRRGGRRRAVRPGSERPWQTDLWLYNPSEQPSTVTVRRVGASSLTHTFSLPPRGSLALPSALQTLSGASSAEAGDATTGALVIDSPYRWGAQLSVYARTHTLSTLAGESGGRYGYAVPAVPSAEGYSTHMPDFRFFLDVPNSGSEFFLDRRRTGQYQHRLGAVNDSNEPLTVRMIYGSEREWVVAPHSVGVMILEDVFAPRDVEGRYPPRLKIAASRPAPVWMTITDAVTGDASFLPYAGWAMRTDDENRLAIPRVAARAGDSTRGKVQSDLFGWFLPTLSRADGWQLPKAFLYPAGGECAPSQSFQILKGIAGDPKIPDDAVRDPLDYSIFPDVVRQFPGCGEGEAVGALEVLAASWMTAYSRTYTTRPDGGTYGEMLPFYPAGGWPVQHFAGVVLDPATSVKLGLYNGFSDRLVTHRLELFDIEGIKRAEASIEIGPKKSSDRLLGDIFGAELPAGVYGLSVTPLDTAAGPGRSWAWVTTTDRITNDPTIWW